MATKFNRPSILVYQELVSTTPSTATPFFELCIVGPAYQVQTLIKFKPYSASEAYTSDYVDRLSGTIVDTKSVYCTLRNAYVKMWPAASETLKKDVDFKGKGTLGPVTKLLALDSTQDRFDIAKVKPGDIADIEMVFEDRTDYYSIPIVEIQDSKDYDAISNSGVGDILVLQNNIPSPAAGVDFSTSLTVRRAIIDDVVIPSTDFLAKDDTLVLNPSIMILSEEADYIAKRLVVSDVYVTYRALRSYLAGEFLQINNTNDVIANLGEAHIDNPLAVACNVVFANANISFKVLPIAKDNDDGYLAAIDRLTTSDTIYVIVPLSQSKEVVSAVANHCKSMSLPEKSKWRITYANMEMPSTKVIVELTDMRIYESNGSIYLEDQNSGAFITKGTRAGATPDYVDIYKKVGKSVTYLYSVKIISVLNNNVVEVSPKIYMKDHEGYAQPDGDPDIEVTSEAITIWCEVTRPLTTQGLTDVMGEIAESFKNKRLRLTQPDSVMINLNSTDYVVPGYYLSVAYGAMRAGFPPHQGFSTLGVGGIKRLFRSNNLFTDDQLDQMAGSGIFWCVQSQPDALPYCIYQATTDNTQLETLEDSVVATIDYASKFLKDNLKNVLGKFNVNEISSKYVQSVTRDVLDKMQRMSYQYIGSIIISGELVSIELKGDKIIPVVSIKVPFPVNAVEVHLQV